MQCKKIITENLYLVKWLYGDDCEWKVCQHDHTESIYGTHIWQAYISYESHRTSMETLVWLVVALVYLHVAAFKCQFLNILFSHPILSVFGSFFLQCAQSKHWQKRASPDKRVICRVKGTFNFSLTLLGLQLFTVGPMYNSTDTVINLHCIWLACDNQSKQQRNCLWALTQTLLMTFASNRLLTVSGLMSHY